MNLADWEGTALSWKTAAGTQGACSHLWAVRDRYAESSLVLPMESTADHPHVGFAPPPKQNASQRCCCWDMSGSVTLARVTFSKLKSHWHISLMQLLQLRGLDCFSWCHLEDAFCIRRDGDEIHVYITNRVTMYISLTIFKVHSLLTAQSCCWHSPGWT